MITENRPPYADEREYILRSWIESYRHAPGKRNLRWRDYLATQGPIFEEILDRIDTRALVSVVEDVIVGWIVFSRGKHADAIHWVQTRYRVGSTGSLLRKRGIMRELLAAAQLKPHVAYTFRGPLPRKNEDGPRASSDTWIVPWLARHGIGAAHVPYSDWSSR